MYRDLKICLDADVVNQEKHVYKYLEHDTDENKDPIPAIRPKKKDDDKKKDVTGDIFLSNYKESEISSSFSRHSTSVKDNSYDLLFPPNYLNHTITFNFDVMNCSKIRLYGIKNPRSVIDNFIMKHVKDHETIKKHY